MTFKMTITLLMLFSSASNFAYGQAVQIGTADLYPKFVTEGSQNYQFINNLCFVSYLNLAGFHDSKVVPVETLNERTVNDRAVLFCGPTWQQKEIVVAGYKWLETQDFTTIGECLTYFHEGRCNSKSFNYRDYGESLKACNRYYFPSSRRTSSGSWPRL